ncbi:hypothetical protein, partial [Pseudomonas aeruginosa]|uniref:hypothetical protein n=1 Tax=Pseudomonas aeruginosa TaxID=287 RepID=UPI003F7E3FA3
ENPQPDLVLERVLPLVEAVARRSAYLVLLTENPGALERLLTLCAASSAACGGRNRRPSLSSSSSRIGNRAICSATIGLAAQRV